MSEPRLTWFGGAAHMSYPDGGRVSVTLGGAVTELSTLAMGRNGTVKCTGLDLLINDTQVTIYGVNSRNTRSRCWIEIPADPATLRKVAEMMRDAAGQIESRRQAAA